MQCNIEQVLLDFFYVMANDKRAIAFVHALDSIPRTRAQIFSDLREGFPKLPKRFFPSPQALGSLVNTLKNQTMYLVESYEIPRLHKGKLQKVRHYSRSDFGGAAVPYITFGLEGAQTLGVPCSEVLGNGGQRQTIETRIKLLDKLLDEGEVSISELRDCLDTKLEFIMRHCHQLQSNGLVDIHGARLKGDSALKSYYVSTKSNGQVPVRPINDLLSARQVQLFLDNFNQFDVSDYVAKGALFQYTGAPKSKKSHQALIKLLVDNSLLEIHANNQATIQLSDKGVGVVANIISPIREALLGDGKYQAVILNYSKQYSSHAKTVVYKIARDHLC